MLFHYLKMAFRSLGKYRMQNIISIVCLSVALFCFSINLYFSRSFIEVDDWLDDDRIVCLRNELIPSVNPGLAMEIVRQKPEVECMFRYESRICGWHETDRLGESENTDNFIFADATLKDVLGLKLLAGNWESVINNNSMYTLVLTESFAKQHYGTIDSLIRHQLFMSEARGVVNVMGVIEDLPYANSISGYKPVAGWIFTNEGFSAFSGTHVLLKLKEGVDADAFIRSFYEEQTDADNTKVRKYRFRDERGGVYPVRINQKNADNSTRLLILLLITMPGTLILIVALFNYFHLLANSILSSRREYALRRINGARTVDMWLMVSIQIIITTLLTGALSLIIARYVTPLISISQSTGSGSKVTSLVIDTDVVLKHTMQYILMLIAVGLVLAWIAVMRLRSADMGNMIKRHYGGRNVMIGIQLTVAQLAITVLVALSLKVRANLNEPYSWLSKEDKTCIITDRQYYTRRHFSEIIERETSSLKSLPYITNVSFVPNEYLRGNNSLTTEYSKGNSLDDEMNCTRVVLNSDMMDILQIPIREGRMPVKKNEILVDDYFIDVFRLGIGDTIRVRDLTDNYAGDVADYDMAGGWIPLVITGRIDNVREMAEFFRALKKPTVYFNWEVNEGHIVTRCLPGYQKETKEAIVKAHYPYAKEDANLSLDEAWSLYDYLDDNNNTWNNIGFMAWIVAIITLIITLLGVYSAISIDTTRRRKEMALRKINGAVTAQIALLFVRLYMKLFAISSVVSIPLSAFIIKGMILNGRYDKGAVYAIIFYLFVLAVMVAFIALTIGFKIRRIARENPADVIKSE